jgi:hypothetical protein
MSMKMLGLRKSFEAISNTRIVDPYVTVGAKPDSEEIDTRPVPGPVEGRLQIQSLFFIWTPDCRKFSITFDGSR